MTSKVTPPKLARSWGVSVEKIIGFIKSGELRAINIASRPNGRPRFLIDLADIEAFERRREAISLPQLRTRRKPATDGIIEYFK